MARLLTALAALAAASTLGATAEPQAPAQTTAARAELPIKAVTLSNGAVRFAVPIRIGGKTLDAALDTGSTGLRVLPGVLEAGDARAGPEPEVYGYASGSRYEGVTGEADVALGAVRARAPLHLIRAIGCYAAYPRCPASRTTLEHYGIASDGLPDEGFKAILGTDMAPEKVANPLTAMGVRRWIVELPRPGERGPGRLILNPTREETEGYVMLPMSAPFSKMQGGGLHDALPGCLSRVDGPDGGRARVCGPVLLDTGSSFLSVLNARPPGPWSPDTKAAALEFFDPRGDVVARHVMTLGSREQATRLIWRQEPRAPGQLIFAGVAPYFAWSVLYDARRQAIGLKARPAAEVAESF